MVGEVKQQNWSGTKELAVEKVLGHFNECWAAMGANEGVFAFKQLFALVISLG